MSSFEHQFHVFKNRFSEKINKSTKYLFDYFNLNRMFYYKITEEGYLTGFDTHTSWDERFVSEKAYLLHPRYRHPDYFQDGIALSKYAENDLISNLCIRFNIKLTLILTSRLFDKVEVFGFSSSSSNEIQIETFLSELPLLHLFIKKFREENPSLFFFLEDSKLDLTKILGPVFYEKNPLLKQKSNARENFLKTLGIETENPLSLREKAIIRLLLQGYPASHIAKQIYLSKRTVEHYLERIKEKLRCQTKTDLIQKAIELEKLAYLT